MRSAGTRSGAIRLVPPRICAGILFCLTGVTGQASVDLELLRLSVQADDEEQTLQLETRLASFEARRALAAKEKRTFGIQFDIDMTPLSSVIADKVESQLSELAIRDFAREMRRVGEASEIFRNILNSEPNSENRGQAIVELIAESSIRREIRDRVGDVEDNIAALDAYDTDQMTRLVGLEITETVVNSFETVASGSDLAAEASKVLEVGKRLKDRYDSLTRVVEEAQKLNNLPGSLQNLSMENFGTLLTTSQDFQKELGQTAVLLAGIIGDEEDAKEVGEFVNYAIAATQIGTAVFSGNPAMLLFGIGGLAGGGSASPSPPHPAVMQALGEILKNQEELLEGQEELLNGQQELLAGQEAILTELKAVERNVLQELTSIAELIESVQWENSTLARAARELSYEGARWSDCETFLESRSREDGFLYLQGRNDPNVVWWSSGEFENWAALENYFGQGRWRSSWFKCLDLMKYVFFAQGADIHTFLRMSNYSAEQEGTLFATYVRRGYRPLIANLREHYIGDPADSEDSNRQRGIDVWCTLLNSPLRFDQVATRGYYSRERDSRCVRIESAVFSDRDRQWRDTEWSELPLLHPKMLMEFVYTLMDILRYTAVMDFENHNPNGPPMLTDRVDLSTFSDAGAYIEWAYRYVNLAIAQQTLTTGDILLPFVHGTLSPGLEDEEAKPERDEMITILDQNKLMAKNYLVRQFRAELALRPGDADVGIDGALDENLRAYRCVYNGNLSGNSASNCQPGHYERLFGVNWAFLAGQNKVLLRDGSEREFQFDMPTPDELQTGLYEVTEEYWDLVELRDRLIEYALRNDMKLFGVDPEKLVRDGNYAGI